MNKKRILFVAIVIVAGLLLVAYQFGVRQMIDDRTVTVVVPTTVTVPDAALSFTYPSGEAGYTLIEPPIPPITVDGLRKVYLIMETAAYLSFQSDESDRETPPAVSVFVLTEPEEDGVGESLDRLARLQMWAEQHPQYTSYNTRQSDPSVIEVDGLKLLQYRADGLYSQEVHLVSYSGDIYVLVGQFIDETDSIRTMYADLIKTLLFE